MQSANSQKQLVFGPNKVTGTLAIVIIRKIFTYGKYVKTFMLDAANELFDDFLDKDEKIKRLK